jgi:hypothetical protein
MIPQMSQIYKQFQKVKILHIKSAEKKDIAGFHCKSTTAHLEISLSTE